MLFKLNGYLNLQNSCNGFSSVAAWSLPLWSCPSYSAPFHRNSCTRTNSRYFELSNPSTHNKLIHDGWLQRYHLCAIIAVPMSSTQHRKDFSSPLPSKHALSSPTRPTRGKQLIEQDAFSGHVIVLTHLEETAHKANIITSTEFIKRIACEEDGKALCPRQMMSPSAR